jgi:glycosyltransferase involved in cell wall biosynthesis
MLRLNLFMARPLRSLYIGYLSLTDPLTQTQVVAYLAGLAQHGHKIYLLTFEATDLSAAEKRYWRTVLREQGIIWYGRRYHKRPSLPATIYDVGCGVLAGLKIVRRHRIDVIHARAHVPAAMALILKKMTGVRFIFDIRGLLAEEREDTGAWKRDSLPFRLTKSLERRYIREADALVVLTERIKALLFPAGAPQPLSVIPCCADLTQIHAQREQRDTMRAALKAEDKVVMIYVGKFGGWYMHGEMVDFFVAAQKIFENLHFLVLTQSDRQMIEDEFARHNVGAAHYTVTSAEPSRVGAYLAAADFAISFISPCPSKLASSPTKIGEYLAGGLPVLCNTGVGDIDTIMLENNVGVALSEFTPPAYEAAARQMLTLLYDCTLKSRCLQAAHAHASLQHIGIPRYVALYESVARGIERDEALRSDEASVGGSPQ